MPQMQPQMQYYTLHTLLLQGGRTVKLTGLSLVKPTSSICPLEKKSSPAKSHHIPSLHLFWISTATSSRGQQSSSRGYSHRKGLYKRRERLCSGLQTAAAVPRDNARYHGAVLSGIHLENSRKAVFRAAVNGAAAVASSWSWDDWFKQGKNKTKPRVCIKDTSER